MSFNNRKTIKATRKEHQCHGCLKTIEIGSEAINESGHNDEWYNVYLHPICDVVISKYIKEIDPFGDGVPEGAIIQLEDYYGGRFVEI